MKATADTIVSEARRLFRDSGYAGMSMQQLADRVGLRKASLYTRFPSKEALAVAVIAQERDETFAAWPDESLPWDEAYRAIVTGVAAALSDARRCIAMHLAYGLNGEAPQVIEAVNAYLGELCGRTAAVLRRGGYDEADAEALSVDTLLRLEGATLWVLTRGDTAPMQRAVASLLAQALPARSPQH